MRPARLLAPTLALVMLPALAAAQHESHTHGGLGTVVFPNSGTAAAQQPFLTGIALLHSFEYERAADALREAQRVDPGFALAYWAEALTFSHVLWGLEDLAASRAALARLGATEAARLAKAGTARERSFGAAVETFYREGTLAERIMAYADAMRAHASAAPDDQEAAAFASHALLMASLRGDPARRRELASEAIGLAQRVATANPEHPGATHYLIHLYDTPGMAAQGLEFARAYDRIAPDAEHALHMPSHIYLQLGLWADVVNSNERAWAASRAESHDAGELDWHAFTWLQYGYLQQGRYRAARALTDSARALLSSMNRPFVDARVALTRLEFQYASETGKWDDAITAPTFDAGPPASDRERSYRMLTSYQRAVYAARRGDPAMGELATAYLELAPRDGPPAVASNARLVSALAAAARGDRDGYRTALEEAAEHERQLDAFVGPPERLFALELLAEELMGEGRPADAARAYEDVLRLCPLRSQALLGLARAHAAAENEAAAAAAWDRLRVNWKNADAEVARLLPGG